MTKAQHNRAYRDRHRAKWNQYRRRWRERNRERINEAKRAQLAEGRAFWRSVFEGVMV